MLLVLDTRGMSVGARNGSLHLRADEHERLVSPKRLSAVLVTCRCEWSAAALRLAAGQGVPVYFLNALGEIEARVGPTAYGPVGALRRAQVFFAETAEATAWATELVGLKTTQQQKHLAALARKTPSGAASAREFALYSDNLLKKLAAHSGQPLPAIADELRGVEGAIARAYWPTLEAALPEAWQFVAGRSQHPARDPFNALLNYTYGMLYTLVEGGVVAAGLDPGLGLLHADSYGQPGLVYDLIEPFRPWADQLCTEAIRAGQVQDAFFDATPEQTTLNKAGKRWLIPLVRESWDQICDLGGRRSTQRQHVYRHAGTLAETLKTYWKTRRPCST